MPLDIPHPSHRALIQLRIQNQPRYLLPSRCASCSFKSSVISVHADITIAGLLLLVAYHSCFQLHSFKRPLLLSQIISCALQIILRHCLSPAHLDRHSLDTGLRFHDHVLLRPKLPHRRRYNRLLTYNYNFCCIHSI